MNILSTRESVMQLGKSSSHFFLLMHRVQSMQATTGTRISGMLELMGGILIFLVLFLHNGPSSRVLSRCQERTYPVRWKTRTTLITVETSRIAISASMHETVRIVIIRPICQGVLTVWTRLGSLSVRSAMNLRMHTSVIIRTIAMM